MTAVFQDQTRHSNEKLARPSEKRAESVLSNPNFTHVNEPRVSEAPDEMES